MTEFWRDVMRDGSPLVEPVAGSDSLWVTFLWRSASAPENVVVVGGVARWEFRDNMLEHLPGSDVWYRSYRVGSDARFTYRLSVDDNLIPFDRDPDWAARAAGFVADSLNPARYPPTSGGFSVFEGPAAPPQPYVTRRANVPHGVVAEEVRHSDRLDNDRRVWVYTPPGWDPAGAAADSAFLLVVFDGGAYTGSVPTPTILDNLRAAGLIPPVVALFVGNAAGARNRELAASEPFAAFVAEVLVPWVRAEYGAPADPRRTIVAGSSFGGLAAAFVALRHPDVFGNVISQSGSFWWRPDGDAEHGWLIRQFRDGPQLGLRFHVEVGLMEDFLTRGGGPSQLQSNRHLRDVLLARGYEVAYTEFNGGHEYLNWQGTLAEALLRAVAR